jgi:hypothetical protein
MFVSRDSIAPTKDSARPAIFVAVPGGKERHYLLNSRAALRESSFTNF